MEYRKKETIECSKLFLGPRLDSKEIFDSWEKLDHEFQFLIFLTKLCIGDGHEDEDLRTVYSTCLDSIEKADLYLMLKNEVCKYKKAEIYLEKFNDARRKYLRINSPSEKKFYADRFNKNYPILNTTENIIDWFCKQDNIAVETQKINICLHVDLMIQYSEQEDEDYT